MDDVVAYDAAEEPRAERALGRTARHYSSLSARVCKNTSVSRMLPTFFSSQSTRFQRSKSSSNAKPEIVACDSASGSTAPSQEATATVSTSATAPRSRRRHCTERREPRSCSPAQS
eukprot:Amastigsp_a178509_10.p3 type:complete len:116 gc:universal Amastigsp_a178509_10:474-821(+)